MPTPVHDCGKRQGHGTSLAGERMCLAELVFELRLCVRTQHLHHLLSLFGDLASLNEGGWDWVRSRHGDDD